MSDDNDIFERLMEHVQPLKNAERVSTKTAPKISSDHKNEKQFTLKIEKRPYDRSLDLHGMHEDEAFYVVERVFKENPGKQILVITGKSGVLRQNFPRWCELGKLKPFIQFYNVAPDEHGGDGAFIVTLKKASQPIFGDQYIR